MTVMSSSSGSVPEMCRQIKPEWKEWPGNIACSPEGSVIACHTSSLGHAPLWVCRRSWLGICGRFSFGFCLLEVKGMVVS